MSLMTDDVTAGADDLLDSEVYIEDAEYDRIMRRPGSDTGVFAFNSSI